MKKKKGKERKEIEGKKKEIKNEKKVREKKEKMKAVFRWSKLVRPRSKVLIFDEGYATRGRFPPMPRGLTISAHFEANYFIV